jgi:hypothetical protein
MCEYFLFGQETAFAILRFYGFTLLRFHMFCGFTFHAFAFGGIAFHSPINVGSRCFCSYAMSADADPAIPVPPTIKSRMADTRATVRAIPMVAWLT